MANPLASRETAEAAVDEMKAGFKRCCHREAAVLVCNNVVLCDLKKWHGALDEWNDPATYPPFRGLKIVATVSPVGANGFVVAG